MNKVIIFFIAVFVFTGMVSVSRAQTITTTTTNTSTVNNDFFFTSTLRIGMSGTVEIVKLQEYLINNGYLQGYADGKFGRLTHAAVARFQSANGLFADGIVGMNTRAILNASITPILNSPIVLSPNGGENWVMNSTELIRWNVGGIYNTNNNVDIYLSTLSGCLNNNYSCVQYAGQTYILDKNISNSIPYNWIVGTDINNQFIPAGNYKVKICVAGTSVCDYSNGEFVISNGNIQPVVRVISPNGGEVWYVNYNSTHPITWNINNATVDTKVDIYLETPRTVNCFVAPCPTLFGSPAYVLDRNIPNYTSYNWIAGTDVNNQTIPPGDYGVKVCIAGTSTCDYSDNSFTLGVVVR